MIAFIEGNVEMIENDRIVISNHGMGYYIFMPASQVVTLRLNETVKVFTYLNVREDAMQLFGFLNTEDLEIFRLLLAVSGIGPKGALAILSTITPDDLRVAIMSGDAKAIAKAPGVGNKTAQKVIIELKDKMNLEDLLGKESSKDIPQEENNVQTEAVMALVSLGYTQTDAFRAVKSIGNVQDLDVETTIKMALKKLY